MTIRELTIDHLLRAVDPAPELGLYADDGCILEAARSSGNPSLALDATIQRLHKELGLPLVEIKS